MSQIEARPAYRSLGFFAAFTVAVLVTIAALDTELHRHFYTRATLLWHLLYATLFVFAVLALIRLVLNWSFRDIALQINETGVYVEGVTRHPVRWADITAVKTDGRFVVFRTTDEDALIHFALFRPSFGRLGWRNFRDVIISAGLMNVSAEEIRRAIQNGMAHAVTQ